MALENTISVIAWNIAAISELEDNIELERALKEENELNHEMLFLLLSLMYDARSIEKVKDNIQNGSTESLGYALELLDIFVSEEIKTLLFPLFDDKPVSEKLRQLQVYFPRAKYNKVEVLIHIMNRDYNTLTRWTKACAVEAYGNLENPELNYDLISNLFNPDRLIRETAARVIFEISPKTYHEVGRRIPSKVKWELDKLVANKDGLFRYQSDRFKFLAGLPYFKSLNNDMMVKLVKEFDLRILKQGASTITNSARTNYVLNIVCSGQVLTNEKGADEVLGEGRIFGPFFTLSRKNSIESKTLSETVLLSLTEEKFYELMYNYREFIEIFVELIDDKSFLEETEIVE